MVDLQALAKNFDKISAIIKRDDLYGLYRTFLLLFA